MISTIYAQVFYYFFGINRKIEMTNKEHKILTIITKFTSYIKKPLLALPKKKDKKNNKSKRTNIFKTHIYIRKIYIVNFFN